MLIIIISVALASFAYAATDDQKLFDFANSLYDSGDHYGAVLEYKRLLSYYPSSLFSEDSSFMIGMGYYKANKGDDSADAFDLFITRYPGSKKAPEALNKLAQAYYRDKEFSIGLTKLNAFKPGRFSDQAEYLAGWGYLCQFDFKGAESVLYYLGTREGSYKDKAFSLSKDVLGAYELPSKSPLLAGVLSAVLPGSGQVYSERYFDGLVSLFLNASFLYLAVSSNNSGNYGSGLFFSAIELGWYTGNIYGGVRAANKFNDDKAEEFVDQLKVKYGFEF